MILQGAAEKSDGFETKLYNDVLPCNVKVVINGNVSGTTLIDALATAVN
jgi:hypothetical protein